MPINWQLSRQRVSPLQEILKTFKAFHYHGATDISDIVFYRTHVHMGSDHWVAMSVHTYNTFFTLVDDPSEDIS